MSDEKQNVFPDPSSAGGIRRGLVLAGGGAKGAYAFGCLQAFRDHGIYFDRVTGTSSGALNAVVWSTQAFDLGDRLWQNLSFDTILPLRIKHEKLPAFIYYIDGGLRVGIQMLLATWSGIPHPLRRTCAFINAVLFAASLILLNILLPVPYSEFGRIEWNLTSIAVGLGAAYMLYAGQGAGSDDEQVSSARFFFFYAATLFFISPAMSGILFPSVWPTHRAMLESLTTTLTSYLGFKLSDLLSVPLGMLFLLFWLIVMPATIVISVTNSVIKIAKHTTREHVFVNTPLFSQLEQLVREHPLRIPTFVCVAEFMSLFRYWIHLKNIPTPPSVREKFAHTLSAIKAATWIPRYIDIRKRTADEATKVLLASASLPFGFLPSVRIDEHEFVDGGIADNVPIFPLIDGSTDELFVVLLDCNSAKEANQRVNSMVDLWSQTDLACRLADLPQPPNSVHEAELIHWQHLDLEERTMPKMPRIVLFYPSQSIGGFLRGTLNFNGQYARRLIALGRYDAEKVLKECRIGG